MNSSCTAIYDYEYQHGGGARETKRPEIFNRANHLGRRGFRYYARTSILALSHSRGYSDWITVARARNVISKLIELITNV